MNPAIRSRTALFAAVALGVYLTATVLGAELATLPHADRIALGITLDLALVVPAAYYWLVVRPRGWPVAGVLPIVIAGVVAAGLVIPAMHHDVVRAAERLLLPAEAMVVGWIAWRATRAARAAGAAHDADPLTTLQAGAAAVIPGRAAAVIASELGVLYYGLAAWRARPHAPPGAESFSTHRTSGHGGLVFALLLITAVEGVVVHVLLANWNAAVAWIVTALTVYGALWLLADYRATVLAPLSWDGTTLRVRCGLRWRARLANAQLRRIARAPTDGAGDAQSLTFLADPNVWIECVPPAELHGPFGLRREATWIGLSVDDADRFRTVIARHHAP